MSIGNNTVQIIWTEYFFKTCFELFFTTTGNPLACDSHGPQALWEASFFPN